MTVVGDYTALLSGSNLNGTDSTHGTPVYVTYSFDDAPAAYLGQSLSQSFVGSFSPLTGAEQSAAHTALQEWDAVSGVTFLQVAPGQGDIRFGNYDFTLDPSESGSAGFTYYPSFSNTATGGSDSQIGSDVFISRDVENYSASDMQHVLIHEIGHALGLKHPFDGSVTLDPSLDNTSETVMSYTGYAPDLGPLDKEAAAYLYGPVGSDGTQDASSNWNPDTETLTQRGTAAANVMRGVSTADRMYGGAGQDILYGEAGSDTLAGGAGHDVLTGGSGADRFVFNTPLGNGNIDRITDFDVRQDHILLSGYVFQAFDLGVLSTDAFVVGQGAESAAPAIVYDPGSGALLYDADGSGSGAAQQFARVQPNLALKASDFRVVG